VRHPPIDYQTIHYYAAPRGSAGPKSLAEVDPQLLATYEKLGIPLAEREALAGVAVDAVFDSVSVATTFKDKLEKLGVVFCSFSEAVHKHPDLVRQYLGSVVPHTDNFFATLNSAVFSDGSFVYVPKGVRCPMELSTYFRINARNSGQFERTLIIADEGAYVSYLEGCTAPMRDENQLHAAVVELVALKDAASSIRRCRTGTPATPRAAAASTTSSPSGATAGASCPHLLDPGGDRLGHHLEVPELHAHRRQLGGRVLLGGADQQPAAGRHRHQDDPHRPQHPQHHRCPRASRPAGAATPTGAW
jgi:hypothetical protein